MLGAIVSHDNSPWPDYWHLHQQAWKAFFANCCRPAVKKCGLRSKMRLLSRTVVPLVDFRSSRWPWSTNICRSQDALQKRMVSIILGIRKDDLESIEGFVSRRGRISAEHARRAGLWSSRHRDRVLSWHAHVLREANSASPAAQIYKYKNVAWLRARRLAVDSPASSSGRLMLRRLTHVNMRWEEGAIRAQG